MRQAMNEGWNTVALLLAAGSGSRAGGDTAKQYRLLAGAPVLTHAYDGVVRDGGAEAVVVVVAAGAQEQARDALKGRSVAGFVEGADTRRGSVKAGLEWIAAQGGAGNVLIHDAARPDIPTAVLGRLIAALATSEGAIPAIAVVDTLVRGDGAVVDRTDLHRVQTPQAFRFATALAVHRAWDTAQEPTDDAQMLRAAGHAVALVPGDERLEKLTYADDFDRLEARLMQSRGMRVGMGYDVHQLVEGEELWLGGIRIPHDKGLSGHSDADVALHALVDAILGALADGDIGSHFPPSDPQWRGAASWQFLDYAAGHVTARGGQIEHLDLTIICEAPKIGPHRDAMRARIATILGLTIDRVSVKATTTERLGFTGRGEGIAAQAVATLSLPALS
ncbi:MAG: bifunctional 2-C-methyl-D-erythritol 4-phosphate cytidylyltransferase/2-C-methyl-D-erythritol 2,4-cyclodiphosphate synthase [Sphingobium sp.]